MLEHMAHGGKENGRLQVTHRDCIACGISASWVAKAQKDAIRRGPVALLKRIEKLEAQSATSAAAMKVRRLIDPSPAELEAIGEDEIVIVRTTVDPKTDR
jgi:hypothetical protein